MFDNFNSQTVNVPKRDLLSIVANAAPGSINGCKWCLKTILFNGGTWVHANDKNACEGIKCDPEWTKDTEPVEEIVGTFFPRKAKLDAPVAQCKRCGERRKAFLYGTGRWGTTLGSYGSDSCKVAVATPMGNVEAGK